MSVTWAHVISVHATGMRRVARSADLVTSSVTAYQVIQGNTAMISVRKNIFHAWNIIQKTKHKIWLLLLLQLNETILKISKKKWLFSRLFYAKLFEMKCWNKFTNETILYKDIRVIKFRNSIYVIFITNSFYMHWWSAFFKNVIIS